MSGLVAAPCTGPVLTGIMLWIGKTRSAALGSLVLFAFSLGLGIPFWLVGTFAVKLPRAGRWMLWTKSFFGIVLSVLALYFLQNVLRPLAGFAHFAGSRPLIAVALLVGGILLGAIHLSFDNGRILRLRKSLGLLAAISGAFLARSLARVATGPVALGALRGDGNAARGKRSQAAALGLYRGVVRGV